jgi:AAA15 family ATPase/GTPase
LEKVSQFLRIADTGIEAVQIYSKSVEMMFGGFLQANDQSTMLEARVVHRAMGNGDSKPIVWSMENESAGTRRLFSLTGPILDALAKGKVLFVDELDNHLHSLLSEMVVGLFNNAETNPLNAQLIFTTHDTSLLKKENFRRDQIWFIEKDHDGASRLFPLSAFDKKTVRWDIPFDRWYLSGRFGATPLIRDYDIAAR